MPSNRKTIITSNFIATLKKIIDYIKQDSVDNARKFKVGVDESILKIAKHPEANSIVRNLPTQRNWYRYKLYKKRYKIIFKVLKNKVIFLGIIHTAQHPDKMDALRTNDYS